MERERNTGKNQCEAEKNRWNDHENRDKHEREREHEHVNDQGKEKERGEQQKREETYETGRKGRIARLEEKNLCCTSECTLGSRFLLYSFSFIGSHVERYMVNGRFWQSLYKLHCTIV